MRRSPSWTLIGIALVAFVLAGCVELQQKVVESDTTSPPADTVQTDGSASGDVVAGDAEQPDGEVSETEDETVAPPECSGEPPDCNANGVCQALGDEVVATCEGGRWVCDTSTLPEEAGYEADEVSCDGFDNDCDGATDEVLPTTDTTVLGEAGCRSNGPCAMGVVALCRGGRWACSYDGIPDYETVEASCDDIDNDCDGDTDEDIVRACSTDCGDGVESCTGDDQWSACSAPQPDDEACDGRDNDCDGATDEDLTAPDDACPAIGVCAEGEGAGVTPTAACLPNEAGGAEWQCDWTGLTGWQASETACDGADNDCDGETDEDITTPDDLAETTCDVDGVCAGGRATCGAGGWECDYTGVAGYEEGTETLCDLLDNDCDGETDEEDGLDPAAADCPTEGVCAPDGAMVPTCTNRGNWSCVANSEDYEGGAEDSCDGLDNDCDGQTDEDLRATSGAPLEACLDEGVCATGTFALCVDASWRCIYPDAREPAELSCDGLDNDCDGDTDEGLVGVASRDCALSVGVCDSPLVQVNCQDGGWSCNYTPIADFEQSETLCDGLDNDCDGATDVDADGAALADVVAAGCALTGVCDPDDVVAVCEGATGYACSYANVTDYEAGDETTCDGKDNDCDGTTDEDLDGDPVAAACKLVGVCSAEFVTASCNGAAGYDCDYTAVEFYEGTETLCDGLDNDCDGTTDEDLTEQTSATTCLTDGVCASGVPATCDSGVWDCNYSGVAGYIAPDEGGNESECDEQDNDCDGETDEGACTGDGAVCTDNTGCDSGFCRTDIDGEGMFCAADADNCVREVDGVRVQVNDGESVCSGNGAIQACAVGVWGAATDCPAETPFCLAIDGACHACQPGTVQCDGAAAVVSCSSTGNSFNLEETCGAGTVCAGIGTCWETGVVVPTPGATGAQRTPGLGWQATTGTWVVAWVKPGTDDDIGVGRVIADGLTYTASQDIVTNGAQSGPAVVTDSNGAYLVAWTNAGDLDGSMTGVYFQRYFFYGFKSGTPVLINTTTAASQEHVRVASYTNAGGTGEAVAVWQSDAGEATGLFFRRFPVSGSTFVDAEERPVVTGAGPALPDVAALPGGSFAVVWQTSTGGGFHEVWLRSFDAAGAPLGDAVVVATVDGTPLPRVAAVPGAGWLVVWLDASAGVDVVGRLFEADGTPAGAEAVLADDIGDAGEPVALAADPVSRQVAVVFTSDATPDDADGTGISLVGVDVTGGTLAASAAVRVNEAVSGNQAAPAACPGPADAFIGAWETPDDDPPGIASRLLRIPQD